jgi:hypothetical protein
MESQSMENLYTVLIGIVIPVFVSRLKKTSWSSQFKFLVAFLFSIAASAVVPMAQLLAVGTFDFGNLLTSLTVIFTTSQVVYQGVFKMLHAEEIVNPQAALLSLIKEEVSMYIDTLDERDVKNVLNPATSASLEIDIKQVDDSEDA